MLDNNNKFMLLLLITKLKKYDPKRRGARTELRQCLEFFITDMDFQNDPIGKEVVAEEELNIFDETKAKFKM